MKENPIQPNTERAEMSPEELHAWILDELGDTELATRVERHPELTAQFLRGDAYLSAEVFNMNSAIKKENPELFQKLLDMAIQHGRLAPLSYERIVGNISEEEKARFLNIERYFATKNLYRTGKNEREKTKEELAAIAYATERLNEKRRGYGLPEIVIEPEQVRMIMSEGFEHGSVGNSNILYQEIQVATENREEPDLYNTAFHELTHLMGYGALQNDEISGKMVSRMYRVGLSVQSRQIETNNAGGEQQEREAAPRATIQKYLRNLNEAMTEEIANRMLAEVPSTEAMIGETLLEHRLQVSEFVQQNAVQFSERKWRPHWISRVAMQNGEMDVNAWYAPHRIVMFELFRKIAERNPESFGGLSPEESEDVLFEMLQKAMFTGNILPFGRLFNDTFGAGKFREYGHLQTIKEQEEFVASL